MPHTSRSLTPAPALKLPVLETQGLILMARIQQKKQLSLPKSGYEEAMIPGSLLFLILILALKAALWSCEHSNGQFNWTIAWYFLKWQGETLDMLEARSRPGSRFIPSRALRFSLWQYTKYRFMRQFEPRNRGEPSLAQNQWCGRARQFYSELCRAGTEFDTLK